jgi:hypothetical protein
MDATADANVDVSRASAGVIRPVLTYCCANWQIVFTHSSASSAARSRSG